MESIILEASVGLNILHTLVSQVPLRKQHNLF